MENRSICGSSVKMETVSFGKLSKSFCFLFARFFFPVCFFKIGFKQPNEQILPFWNPNWSVLYSQLESSIHNHKMYKIGEYKLV